MTSSDSTTDNEYVKYRSVSSPSQSEINKRLLEVQNRVVEPNRGDFIPELSPDYNPLYRHARV